MKWLKVAFCFAASMCAATLALAAPVILESSAQASVSAIKFTLQASDDSGIKEAVLTYWTPGTEKVEKVFAYASSKASLKETFEGVIVTSTAIGPSPGYAPAVVFYRWTVKNARAEQTVSEVSFLVDDTETKVLTDESWYYKEGQNFIILYNHEAMRTFVEKVLIKQADSIYEKVTKDLDYTPQNKTPVYIVGVSSPSEERNTITSGGFAVLEFMRDVPRDAQDAASLSTYQYYGSLIAHEFTHVALTDITDQFLLYNWPIPGWLQEGLAYHESWDISTPSGNARLSRWDALRIRNAARSNSLIPLGSTSNDMDGWLWLSESRAFIAYLEDTYGWDRLIQFIHEIGNVNKPGSADAFGTAFLHVYGKNFSELESQWSQSLKNRYSAALSVSEVSVVEAGPRVQGINPVSPLPLFWSPDSSSVYYTQFVGGGVPSAYQLSLRSGNTSQISGEKSSIITDLSKDGKQLLLSYYVHNYLGDLYRIGLGDQREQKLLILDMMDSTTATWIPGAREEFVFIVTTSPGEQSIYRGSAQGLPPQALIKVPGLKPKVLPSPDGRSLAYFNWNPKERISLAVSNIDGSNSVLVKEAPSKGEYSGMGFSWSPGSTSLVFSFPQSDGSSDLYIATRKDGQWQSRVLLENGASNRDPAWFPDRTWIVFSSDKRGKSDIYLVKPDGSSLTLLTGDDRENVLPYPSPDGRKLAYYTFNKTAWDMSVIYLDRSQLK